jgi:integration host factor subunit beta
MVKSELIASIQRAFPNLPSDSVRRAVEVFFEEISGALENGSRVEIRGFGAFSIRQRPAREGRNPKTGDPVSIAAKRVMHFRPGKELRARVNGGIDPES